MPRFSRRMPAATLSILLTTGIVTAMQFVIPGLLGALERNPDGIARHQWWRLISPLLVHNDGWRQIAFDFPAIFITGSLAERLYGPAKVLVIYFLCGLLGEVCGYAWQPHGAGSSIAGAGLLGALAFWLVVENWILQGKFGGALLLAGAVVLTVLRDIHGPPLLTGACLAGLFRLWKPENNATGFQRDDPVGYLPISLPI